MEVIHTPPTHDSFTPLSTHQSQTPESFFSGPAVLYHHSPSATLSLHSSDLDAAPAFSSLAVGTRPHRSSNGTSRPVNGHSHDAEEGEEDSDSDLEFEIPNIDIWVTSENLTLYSPTLTTGLSIPYPSISLHALQPHPHPALFLQLLTQAHVFDDFDNDEATISVNIIPKRTSAVVEGADAQGGSHSTISAPPLREREEEEEEEEEEEAQALYTALSACANLHPDPLSGSDADVDDQAFAQVPGVRFGGDQDCGQSQGGSGVYALGAGEGFGEGAGRGGELPPPMPGSGGWITAENVGEFFDGEGNWRGRGGGDGEGTGARADVGLGAGAGSVRAREDRDRVGDGEEGDAEEEETKWRRTE